MRRDNDLGRDPIGRLVFRIAVPSMMAQLVSVLYSIVDRMYIGNIPVVGDVALAGVGVCGPVVTMVGSVASLVGLGGAPLMSIRMGEGEHAAIVLPGDVVYGCSGGVLFIPPQLVMEVVDSGAKTQVKDIFGFEMITLNRFTPAQIDKNTWTVEMLDMLMEFINNDPRGAEYRGLDWSKEYDMAINGDPNDTQSAL